MDLDRKYELGEVVANDGESKTFRAREIATGRELFVHIIYGGRAQGREPLLHAVLQYSMNAAPEKRRQILEVDNHKGMPYAATEVIPDFQGLRAWIERERTPEPEAAPAEPDRLTRAQRWQVPVLRPDGTPAKPEAAAIPQEPAESAAPPHQGGSFTALFRTAVGDSKPAESAAPAVPSEPQASVSADSAVPPVTPSAPPSAHTPGEFTMLFGKPPVASDESAPAVAPPPIPPSAPAFEKSPLASDEPVPPPQEKSLPQTEAQPTGQMPQATSRPGEFTMLFGKSPLASDEPVPPQQQKSTPEPEPQPTAQMPQATSRPGEFTMLFGKSPLASDEPVPPPQQKSTPEPEPQATGQMPQATTQPGEFTMLFAQSPVTQRASGPDEWMGSAPAAAPPAPPARAGQPSPAAGSFTALFQSPGAPPSQPQSAPMFSAPPVGGQPEFGAAAPLQSKTPFAAPPTPTGPANPFGAPSGSAPANPFAAPQPAGPSNPFGAPPPPPKPTGQDPQSFTKYFSQPPLPGQASPTTPAAGARPTSATSAFSVSTPQFPQPSAPAPSLGPGEYTRMFGGAPQPPSMPAAGMPPASGAFGGQMPQAPAMQPPQMPGMQPPQTQMPGMQMPGMQPPQMQMPQAPGMQMPQAAPPAAAPGGAKGLQLVVVILAVLFIFALAAIAYLLLRK